MMQRNQVTSIFTILVAAIACWVSFHGYAGFLVPDLDSDQAIQALMASDLQLPADLYYWGQQRGGSIVPVLGHFLLKHTSLSALEAVSYAHYLILVIGYLSFASIFRSNLARLFFAIIWFLPPHPFGFLLMLGHPYAAQLSFLALAVALIQRLPRKQTVMHLILRHLMITSAVVCLFISVWASDFTLITLVLLSVFTIFSLLYRMGLAFKVAASRLGNGLLLLGLIILEIINISITSRYGIEFIHYAKQHAASSETLFGLSSLAQAKILFSSVAHTITKAAAFKADTLLNVLVFSIVSFWAFAITFVIVYGLFLAFNRQLRKSSFHRLQVSAWFWFFLANAIIGFAAIIFSEWVYVNALQNGSERRYFVPIYIFGAVAALLLTEGIPKVSARPLWAIITVIAVSGSATLPASVYGLEHFPPAIQRLQSLQKLGTAGIIGSHWNSYLLCSVNPKQLSCTQFDEYGQSPCPTSPQPVHPFKARCHRCVNRVLNSPAIYLVKNSWLETFPDQIEQFGTCLVKTGKPFDLAGYTLAAYQAQGTKTASLSGNPNAN
jgi:hypothetical protein